MKSVIPEIDDMWKATVINSLASIFLMLALAANASPLSDYRWQQRPLLIFSPDADDVRLHETMQGLSTRQCELSDRLMNIIVILGTGQSTQYVQPLLPQHAVQLRKRFGLSSSDFAVLLIGKDGHEKYRAQSAPELSQIFALVDSMPMRIDEMNANPVDCGGSVKLP